MRKPFFCIDEAIKKVIVLQCQSHRGLFVVRRTGMSSFHVLKIQKVVALLVHARRKFPRVAWMNAIILCRCVDKCDWVISILIQIVVW